MATKIELKEEEIELIRYLYKEKFWSMRKISRLFNIAYPTMRGKVKKHIGTKQPHAGFAVCKICGETFTKKVHNQKCCSEECSKIAAKKKRREYEKKQRSPKKFANYLEHIFINNIRREFWRLIKSNPKKAVEYYDQMKKEEGKEFTTYALGSILESDEFRKMNIIYEKFKKVFEANLEELYVKGI